MLPKIRAYSDLHLEKDMALNKKPWLPPLGPDEKNEILLLSGDIWYGCNIFNTPIDSFGGSWMHRISERFMAVVLVLGNHDYWDSTLQTLTFEMERWRKNLNLQNVHILQDDSVLINGIEFFGATLWTDLGGPIRQNETLRTASDDMRGDFSRIHSLSGDLISSYEIIKSHEVTKALMLNHTRSELTEKLVFVSHHVPLFDLLSEDMWGNRLNAYFASPLNHVIQKALPDAWFFGHTHHSVRTSRKYGEHVCEFICNPRGYEGYELNPNFNPNGEVLDFGQGS